VAEIEEKLMMKPDAASITCTGTEHNDDFCARLSPTAVALLDAVRRYGDPLGRWRTHDHAAAGIDSELLAGLDSADEATRARAADELERRINVEQDGGNIEVIGNAHPLVPDGIYGARFSHHETGAPFGDPRVFLWFRIVGGEFDGIRICAAFPVHSLIGTQGRAGRFRLTGRQKLYAMLRGLFGRPDRMNLNRLRGRPLLIATRTVVVDRHRQPLPASRQYSMVADIALAADA
jgi:hypothetical protein